MSTKSSHQLRSQILNEAENSRFGVLEYSGAALVAVPVLLAVGSIGHFTTAAVRLRSQLQATWTQFMLLDSPTLRDGIADGFETYLWPPTRALTIFTWSPAWLVLVATALVCLYTVGSRSIADDSISDRRRSWYRAPAMAPVFTALAVAPMPLSGSWLALWQQGLRNPAAFGSALVLSFLVVSIGALLSLLCLRWLRQEKVQEKVPGTS